MIDSPLLVQFKGFVDGSWVGADSGELVQVHNPADGELLAAVPNMGRVETDRAVEAARAALSASSSLKERTHWLSSIDQLLRDNKKELGRIITLEQGKPWPEAQVEVEYAAGFFRYYAEHLHLLESRELHERPKSCRWKIYPRPVGVAALITPWNFPIAMLAKKLAAALAADCSAVLKPSVKTPLTVIALCSLLETELSLPAGKINLVLGRAGPIGDALCSNPKVSMLSFTGSTQVGASLIEKSAPQVKRLALELGGNAPFVVFADADLDDAVENLVANKFRAAGQTCVCANRVLVESSVSEEFALRLGKKVERLTVGNGMDDGVDLGPLIDAEAYRKVRNLLLDALDKGAIPVAGVDPGELAEAQPPFFPPMVLRGVTGAMACSREEIFGPLIAIADFFDEEQAVAMANDTDRGLAAYVFSGQSARAERVASRIRAGHVGVNTGTGPTPEAPFGGVKTSGFGREGGVEGLHEFVETQTMAISL
ncbi:NAD-dependent succinate-semialdehyde dehydrogenase [Gilvimarinus sp. F26214L]|uniref:NAD-dependent succinate-semialdehyde dehydrogenase n=1 Tax=Gilvimarinus sp. DZF01 TaxID=3461371 RepID=UPI0040458A77